MLWKMAIHRCLEGQMSSLELQVELLMTFATWRNLLLLVALEPAVVRVDHLLDGDGRQRRQDGRRPLRH